MHVHVTGPAVRYSCDDTLYVVYVTKFFVKLYTYIREKEKNDGNFGSLNSIALFVVLKYTYWFFNII